MQSITNDDTTDTVHRVKKGAKIEIIKREKRRGF